MIRILVYYLKVVINCIASNHILQLTCVWSRVVHQNTQKSQQICGFDLFTGSLTVNKLERRSLGTNLVLGNRDTDMYGIILASRL
jgi:hypothetical protein